MRSLFIGGVNGVGKSFIIENICKRLSHAKRVGDASSFIEYLKLNKGDYKALRILNSRYKNIKYGEFVKEIMVKNRDSDNILLFDGHYLNFNENQVIDVTGPWMTLIDKLVLIESKADILYSRIVRDLTIKDREISKNILNKKLVLKKLTTESVATKNKYKEVCQSFKKEEIIISNDLARNKAIEQVLSIIV